MCIGEFVPALTTLRQHILSSDLITNQFGNLNLFSLDETEVFLAEFFFLWILCDSKFLLFLNEMYGFLKHF